MALENTDEYKEWLSKVQQNGHLLQDVSEEFCLAAVQQYGNSLKLSSEARRTEVAVLLWFRKFVNR